MDFLQATKLESTLSVKPPFICVCLHACELLNEKVLKKKARWLGCSSLKYNSARRLS